MARVRASTGDDFSLSTVPCARERPAVDENGFITGAGTLISVACTGEF